MSVEVERLIARLEVQQNQFDKALRRAQANTNRAARGIENRFKRTNATVTKDFAVMGTRIATVLGGALGFGVGFGASQLVGGIRSAVGELSALGKEARAASLPVEDLQGLIRGFERNTTVNGAQVSRAFTDFAQRVGEAAQGTGELKRVVDTYGLSLTDANGNLRSQRELLNEVANLIRSAPNDQARTMIANAAFGEPGRQMADALRGGSEALDGMIADARAAGDVIDRDLIQRAELLDDKFDALTRRVGTFFKTLAVGAAGAGLETPLDTLERLFGSVERAQAALGDDLFGALTAELGALDQVAGSVERISVEMEGLIAPARQVQTGLQQIYGSLQTIGDRETALRVGSLASDFRRVIDEFERGEMSAVAFASKVEETVSSAEDLIGEITSLDTARLDGISGRFAALADSVMMAIRAVQALKAEAGVDDARGPSPRGARRRIVTRREATDAFLAEEARLASRTREQIDLETELGRVQRRARDEGVALTEAQANAQAQANLAARQAIADLNKPAGGSASGRGGGGGGGSRESEFARAVEAIQQRTWALEAEAAALILTANVGGEYANSIDFARKKAELMVAAQREGLQVTPELEASIDRLAGSYVRASTAAEENARAIQEAGQAAARHAQVLGGLFTSIIEGSDSARSALASFFATAASNVATKAFQGLLGPSGLNVLSWLGFAQGGYTGDGGKYEPKGVVHGGEYVFSKQAVKRAGVQNLDALHGQLKGFSQGGFVGARAGGAPAAFGGTVRVIVEEAPGFAARVRAEAEGVALQVTRSGLQEYDRSVLPKSIQRATADPRRRG